ncbi:MAG: DNA polymerase I [Desulfatirhabdiaceae bacterium]
MTTQTVRPTLFLIDGTAYIHRAYHAIRGLTNSRGLPTNAILGFTKILVKLLEDHHPEYAVVCFDAKGPTFRHQRYPEYKANRPPMPEDMRIQIPHIREVTKGFNLQIMEMPGFEADDLIGSLAQMGVKSGFSVVIVTGDKDFIQLISETIRIWDPMKELWMDLDQVRDVHGVEPEQFIDIMGLSGDTADNVPGVPGIGPKTALALIQQYKSLAGLYQNIRSISSKVQQARLIQYKDQAWLSRELVTICLSVPVPNDIEQFRVIRPDSDKLAQLFASFEFRQFQQFFSRTVEPVSTDYRTILTQSELNNLAETLKAAGIFAIDTETTSTNPMLARLVGISVAVQPNQAFYIPIAHDYLFAPPQLDLQTVLSVLGPILADPTLKKIGQNIKYDWIVLTRCGVSIAGIFADTMIASYLLNPSKRSHGLDQIALDFLNHKNISYADVTEKGKIQGFNRVSIESATPYACEDADITLRASRVLLPKIQDTGLMDLFNQVEMPLAGVLMKMEMRGIHVDQNRLRLLSASFQDQLSDLEDKIYDLAEERFNIQSHQQLGHILFEKLRLPVHKKTHKKTGYSTDVDVLTSLAEHHKLPELVLRHRTLSKLKSTYADALIGMIHPKTGRIHTSYNQTVTATGRLSSSDPNLQNIPIRTEEGRDIRRAFVPTSGFRMVAADYSQIELRILAHCSDDPILIQSFLENQDIHTRTASEVFQVAPDQVTPELRRQAKVINFGILYGMGAFSLSKELGISQKMAKTYIDHYFDRYRGVKTFIDRTIQEVRISRQTSTLLGRIRLLSDINSTNTVIRQFAERIAVNTPIQGTAADLIKIAMIRMDQAMGVRKMASAMLLTVHDELVFEVPNNELDDLMRLVTDIMENVWELKVPLKVNIAVGDNWAEAH